jgi:hypothetical protein
LLLIGVTSLAVACSAQADLGGGAQPIGGRLSGLTPGQSITLQNNAGDSLKLSANGAFTFPTRVAGGGAYGVTILTPPSSPIAQICTLANATGTVGTAPVTNVTVDCDLLAYFPFSGNANDESGYGHDGVVSEATLTTDRSKKANSAYAFTGSASANIQASMPVGFLPSGDAPRTLTAWLMPTQSNTTWNIAFWGTGNCTGDQFGLADRFDKAAFWGGCNDWPSTLALPLNQWTFFAVVYTPKIPSSITLYVNDLSATGTIVALQTPVSTDFVMGGSVQAGSPMYFTGNLDSVRVYGRALGPDEVESLATVPDP